MVSGESIYAIAKKYKVTEADIYQLNPKVKGAVLQLNTIILVPNKNKNNKQIATEVVGVEEHIVQKGETLFSISKKYSTSIFILKEINPNLNDRGLQIGSKINLKPTEPSQVLVTSTINSIDNDANFHIVQPKETKFGIAKKYGLTIGQLKQQEKTIKAKKLLENGALSTNVAYELGFFDQSHFIKYFKKMWATTPKNF